MSDLSAFINIYKKYFGNNANTIVEIGSRDGVDSFYLSTHLNSNKVFIFEPNPDCYQLIKQSYPQFNTFDIAISNFSGVSTFNVVRSQDWEAVGTSSLRDRNDNWYDDKAEKIIVSVATMEELISRYEMPLPIDVLKLDVEGCTYEVLEGFGKYLQQIKSMHIETETYEFWKDQKLDSDIRNFLESNGFILSSAENFGEYSLDEIWVNGSFI